MDYEQTVSAVVEAARDYRRHDLLRVEAALDAGRHLIEAKDAVQHGDFAALLERAELKPRTARDWMILARAGVKTATVAVFGGIRATLERIREVKRDLHPDNVGDNDCPTCRPGSTAWNLRDGRCRSHLTKSEYREQWEATDWDSTIGEALNSITVQ